MELLESTRFEPPHGFCWLFPTPTPMQMPRVPLPFPGSGQSLRKVQGRLLGPSEYFYGLGVPFLFEGTLFGLS